MPSTDGIKIHDIVYEIKSKLSSITLNKAWKTKQIVNALVEGDVVEYTLLWRYFTELMRVNSGNTCKIIVTRVGDLEP